MTGQGGGLCPCPLRVFKFGNVEEVLDCLCGKDFSSTGAVYKLADRFLLSLVIWCMFCLWCEWMCFKVQDCEFQLGCAGVFGFVLETKRDDKVVGLKFDANL